VKSSIFWDIMPCSAVDFHHITWHYIPEYWSLYWKCVEFMFSSCLTDVKNLQLTFNQYIHDNSVSFKLKDSFARE
jgi:hypothetical protein